MSERKPLVIIAGVVQELPIGDTVPASASFYQPVVSQAAGDTEPSLVFETNANGHLDVIMETGT